MISDLLETLKITKKNFLKKPLKAEKEQWNGKSATWQEWRNTNGRQRKSRTAEHYSGSVFFWKKNNAQPSASRIKDAVRGLQPKTSKVGVQQQLVTSNEFRYLGRDEFHTSTMKEFAEIVLSLRSSW